MKKNTFKLFEKELWNFFGHLEAILRQFRVKKKLREKMQKSQNFEKNVKIFKILRIWDVSEISPLWSQKCL